VEAGVGVWGNGAAVSNINRVQSQFRTNPRIFE
jgi:hypothetical protein